MLPKTAHNGTENNGAENWQQISDGIYTTYGVPMHNAAPVGRYGKHMLLTKRFLLGTRVSFILPKSYVLVVWPLNFSRH